MPVRNKRVCSSAWLERTPDKGEVGGSSPPRPTIHLIFLSLKDLTHLNIKGFKGSYVLNILKHIRLEIRLKRINLSNWRPSPS